ncbi:MAG: hypothetical protein KDA28_15795, partial [Phycisphaerales bacterium]|nr:hypothetical protein [Phycisphaerales bacterium]
QTIRLESDDVTSVTLRLRDALIDLDAPITVRVGDRTVFNGVVSRTEEAIRTSLTERADPTTAATAILRVSWD